MDNKEQIIDPYEDDLEEDEPHGLFCAVVTAMIFILISWDFLLGLACSIFRRKS